MFKSEPQEAQLKYKPTLNKYYKVLEKIYSVTFKR